MRKFKGLAALLWKLGVLCILCIPWSLQAENPEKKSADHSVASGSAGEKTAPASEYDEPKTEVNPTLRTFQEKVSAMADRALLEFMSKLSAMATLNPESFDALVDALPPLADPAEKDAELKKELKAEFRAKASELGPNAKEPLLKIVTDEAESRFKKPGQTPAEFKKILDERIAELKKKDDETAKALQKELDEKNKALQDQLAKGAELNKNPNQGLDPNALAGLGQGQGQGAGDPGAGSGDSGSGSGGGSGGGSPSGGSGGDKSSGADKAKPENKASTAFNDFAKALDSKPDESKPATAEKSDSSSTPRAKSSLSDEDKKTASTGPDASGAGNANPILPDSTPLPSKPGKLGQLGSRSALSSIPASGASADPNAAAGSAGGAGGGGMPMMAGGGGSAAGSSSGGSFPFASPAGGGPGSDQKFDYTRDAKYGASGGEGGSSFDGGGEDAVADSDPTLGAFGGTLVNASRARPRGVSGEEPAFMSAVNQMLGGLCASGNLECNRTKRKPASGRK